MEVRLAKPVEVPRRAAVLRRRVLKVIASAAAAAAARVTNARVRNGMFNVVTLGDSILDCARYNEHGVHPGRLIVRNDDRLFPDFAGIDARGVAAETRSRPRGHNVGGCAAVVAAAS